MVLIFESFCFIGNYKYFYTTTGYVFDLRQREKRENPLFLVIFCVCIVINKKHNNKYHLPLKTMWFSTILLCSYISAATSFSSFSTTKIPTQTKHTHTFLHQVASKTTELSLKKNNDGDSSESSSRRKFFLDSSSAFMLTTAVGVTSVTTTAFPFVANAEVSQGNSLPDGAAQFARVLKTQENLRALSKRVSEEGVSESPLEDQEWENLSQFLRLVFATGKEDMKFMTKSMYDPAKKTRGEEISKQVQKFAQAGDIPAQKKDLEKFKVILEKLQSLFDEFLELLQDVPDEL